MNYVSFSGIYQVRAVANVFCEITANPPGLLILGSNWRSSSSFIAFGEVGGWEWAGKIFWLLFVDVEKGIQSLPLV